MTSLTHIVSIHFHFETSERVEQGDCEKSRFPFLDEIYFYLIINCCVLQYVLNIHHIDWRKRIFDTGRRRILDRYNSIKYLLPLHDMCLERSLHWNAQLLCVGVNSNDLNMSCYTDRILYASLCEKAYAPHVFAVW